MLFSTPQGPCFTWASVFCRAVPCQEGSSQPLPHGWSEQSCSRVEAHPLPYVQKTFIKHFREQWQREKQSLEAEMVCKEASRLLESAARNGAHSHGKLCSKGWIMEAREPEA